MKRWVVFVENHSNSGIVMPNGREASRPQPYPWSVQVAETAKKAVAKAMSENGVKHEATYWVVEATEVKTHVRVAP